jgi:hypothetical protein
MQLETLARTLADTLGPNFTVRAPYRFAVPENGGLREERATAVIFSTRVPSIQTAAVGFIDQVAEGSTQRYLEPYAFLGAPWIVAGPPSDLRLFEYRGSPVAFEVDPSKRQEGDRPEQWLRQRIVDADSQQLPLQLAGGRDVLLGHTWSVLSHQVRSIMAAAIERGKLSDLDAFRVAIAVFRNLVFGDVPNGVLDEPTRRLAEGLAAEYRESITFANLPPESVAELYESLAVGFHERRRSGVVYTPAWLARYVVKRLPRKALTETAVDPACGSGTFLVSFLERLIESLPNHEPPSPAWLTGRVIGYDKDPVAIEAARLALDFFAQSLGLGHQEWTLRVADSTESPIAGDWLIGNLPFGYRSHDGKGDLSSAILQNVIKSNAALKGMSLILPDSLAYTKVAADSRRLLRESFNIQEITRLPESVFTTSTAKTLTLTAAAGTTGSEILVREVSPIDLRGFRAGQYISRSYTARLPDISTDPWRFSPFSNEIEVAERRGRPLEEFATIRIGLQVYGREDKVISVTGRMGRPLLMQPEHFATWTPRRASQMPRLLAERQDVRRPGPWEMMDHPKVIVRATTDVTSPDRLLAVPDNHGIWFTDKFVGIWPHVETLDIQAIAAYLQTRFAAIWFDCNNPSRKLRVRTLAQLPVPALPPEWWQRGAALARLDYPVRRGQHSDDNETLLIVDSEREGWTWFNDVVESALGISVASGTRMARWLAAYDDRVSDRARL